MSASTTGEPAGDEDAGAGADADATAGGTGDASPEDRPSGGEIEDRPSGGELEDRLSRRLDEVSAALARLDGRIAERDRLAERDRDLVDRLHAENQRLRAGEAFQVIASVARDLVRLRDQARQLDAASPAPGRSDAAVLEPQLVQILARMGVETYEPDAGDRFDGAWHQGVGRRPTAAAGLDGTIAEVRREGFVGPDGRPLRPAEVEVWRHDPTLVPPSEPEREPEPAGAAGPDAQTADDLDPYAAPDDSPQLGGD